MPQPGEKFGRYIIRSLLGTGGMGEVYLAEDTELERLAALKILRAEFAENAPQTERFIREAKAASALNHPNILTIYEIGDCGGARFMASELVEGRTLSQIIEEKELSLPEILEIAAQIVSALAAAHRAGIIHRDIKPDNLMIREDNLVKVLDFGIAKLIEKEAAPHTRTGTVIGTPQYMSPEQAEGESLDARTDLWSFGAVFYEMLTGEKAFGGSSVAEILVSVMMKEPPSIRLLKPEIPAGIEAIVNRLLRKNRDERFQSAAELAEILNRLKKRLEFGSFDLDRSEISSDVPHNLPENPFPLIGRERETGEICARLRDEKVRLVTLTGIGGTGKTRLSLAVARELLNDFPDGVFFIELAAISNPELFATTVAQPLGVREAGGKPILDALKEFLREKKILLVLDNFEQITSAAALVAEISNAAPRLKIIVSSRATLRLSHEREFKVPTLKLPRKQASADELLNNEAVKLFIERARKIKPNFTLTGEILRIVAEICARLEGLPLAIEFAAARSRILSPAAILAKLEKRLPMLGGGAQDLPTRQQTMRGAIDWSYELLEPDEKILFRRLAVFAGGFTFEAAESVVPATAGQPAADGDRLTVGILDGITSLFDKSLIFSKENAAGEPRFQMLEVVREYALEVLDSANETAAIRRNHAKYFLALVEQAEPQMRGADSAQWLERLDEENDNLRSAIEWSLEKDEETAIRLTAALSFFWLFRGNLTEGYRWLKAASRKNIFVPSNVRFNLLYALGWINLMQANYQNAQKFFEEILITAKTANDLRQIARAARGLTNTLAHLGDFAAARRFCEEGLAVSRRLNEQIAIADALNSLGNLALMEDDPAKARPFFEESLAIAGEFENKLVINSNLINLGTVNFYEGDYQKASDFYAEGLRLARELGNKVVVSYCLDGFAALAVNAGNFEQAAKLAGAAEALLNSISAERELIERRFREAYLAKIRAALTEAEFSLFYEIGHRMTHDEAADAASETDRSIS